MAIGGIFLMPQAAVCSPRSRCLVEISAMLRRTDPWIASPLVLLAMTVRLLERPMYVVMAYIGFFIVESLFFESKKTCMKVRKPA